MNRSSSPSTPTQPEIEQVKALQELLRSDSAKVARLYVPAHANDLNSWMQVSPEWDATMVMAVRAAAMTARRARGVGRR